ncbi:MAG TPA: xylan 1,4-beta-xylosidase, partial [Hyphomonadaceae bacterium]|nr:xylan 1,4-beta-xylosidase [Hyphomonadaceae bacterium]
RRRAADIPAGTETLFIRMKNDEHVLTYYFSLDGESWSKMDVQMEVSGYHHNVAYGFLSLRPGIYSSREGAARFYNLQNRALRDSR